MTTPIVIDLEAKPYRGILYDIALARYASATEHLWLSSEPEQPQLWNIIGAPERKDILAAWAAHISEVGQLCEDMQRLTDPDCLTFAWTHTKGELVEGVKAARAGVTEWVGEAAPRSVGRAGGYRRSSRRNAQGIRGARGRRRDVDATRGRASANSRRPPAPLALLGGGEMTVLLGLGLLAACTGFISSLLLLAGALVDAVRAFLPDAARRSHR